MADNLTLEVSVEQIAEVVHRMQPEMRRTLVTLVPELLEVAGLVTTITHYPEDGGYLARCISLDAVAWGNTVEEVREELVGAVIETAETLVENVPNPSRALRRRLPYARVIYERRHDRDQVKSFLGLMDDGV